MTGPCDRLRLLGSFGTNKVMAGELSRLVRRAYDDVRLPDPGKDGPSSVLFPFDPRVAAVALTYHRTCARLLWEVFEAKAVRLEPLYDELRGWLQGARPEWLSDVRGISVAVHGETARFQAGERQLVGTVKNALVDAAETWGQHLHLEPEHPDLLLDVRCRDAGVVIALDLAGRPMYQRGYRSGAGIAPLREDVAASLVMLSRHNPRREALIDPMAGSGTIGIEALSMASGRPNWCSGRGPLGAGVVELSRHLGERPHPLFGDTRGLAFLGDSDPQVSESRQRNLETAGVGELAVDHIGDFASWDAREIVRELDARGMDGGLILSNPPYGERMGDSQELLEMYTRLGRWCRTLRDTTAPSGRTVTFRAGFIVAHPEFERAFGGRARVKKPMRNGALKATFYLYE